MDVGYCTHLAAILRKAHGVVDPETGTTVDVGEECVALRRAFDAMRAERDALKSQLYNSCEYERHDPEGCTCPLGYRLTEVEAERDALRAMLLAIAEWDHRGISVREAWDRDGETGDFDKALAGRE